MIYLRLAGVLLVTAVIFGSGYRVGGEHWQTKYEALQAADWQGQAERQQQRADTLDSQIRSFKGVLQEHSKVENELRQQRDQAVGDSQRFAGDLDRLRHQATGARSGGCPVPQTADQSGASSAGSASSDGRLDQLLGAAIAECRANTRAQNALIQEITPQL